MIEIKRLVEAIEIRFGVDEYPKGHLQVGVFMKRGWTLESESIRGNEIVCRLNKGSEVELV
jgi:hypothetical protein